MMSNSEIKVKPDTQNRTIKAWDLLLALIEKASLDGREEFIPSKELGIEHWQQIRSLPKGISKLTQVKHLLLYGSNLTRFPQEVGKMTSLEKFTPYTSYGLRWFPYEITNCPNLKDSTVSTRALFGNYKTNKPFPDLTDNPVRYYGGNKCSICEKAEPLEGKFDQYWISVRIATDVLPLLAIVCSETCKAALRTAESGYFPTAHKGGAHMKR